MWLKIISSRVCIPINYWHAHSLNFEIDLNFNFIKMTPQAKTNYHYYNYTLNTLTNYSQLYR